MDSWVSEMFLHRQDNYDYFFLNIVTRKETEEYVLSDDEPEPEKKKSKSEEVKQISETKPDVSKPVAKTKQKNIMSFFTRK